MHAASVHPEPGSNSLKNINLSGRSPLNPFFRANNLSFFLLFELYSNVFLNEIPFTHTFVFSLTCLYEILLFNFQGSMLVRKVSLAWQLCYYITTFFVCQVLFQKFLKFSFNRSAVTAPSLERLISIRLFIPFVKGFLKVFLDFYIFLFSFSLFFVNPFIFCFIYVII